MRVYDTVVIYFLVVHVVSGIRSISKPQHMFKCRDTTKMSIFIVSLKTAQRMLICQKEAHTCTFTYIHINNLLSEQYLGYM